jgi:hypothetical protein
MPRWGLVVLLLFAPVVPAAADEVRIHLIAHGALEADASAAHAIDGAHFCSAAPNPWRKPDEADTRARPYPFYRLVFGQKAPTADLERPGPSIGLALSDYFAAARDHSNPADDSIEVVLEGHHFVGHAGLADPGYRFAVTYRDDRAGGGFVARHLHEVGTGRAVIDLEGNWECPPVVADEPEITVAEHRLFPGARPLLPSPHQLRLERSDIPCVDPGCASWRVTDDDSGDAFLARVDFRHLRLAAPLRREAEQGMIQLLVNAAIRPGRPPRVLPLQLAGVMPVRALTLAASEAGPPPSPR